MLFPQKTRNILLGKPTGTLLGCTGISTDAVSEVHFLAELLIRETSGNKCSFSSVFTCCKVRSEGGNGEELKPQHVWLPGFSMWTFSEMSCSIWCPRGHPACVTLAAPWQSWDQELSIPEPLNPLFPPSQALERCLTLKLPRSRGNPRGSEFKD